MLFSQLWYILGSYPPTPIGIPIFYSFPWLSANVLNNRYRAGKTDCVDSPIEFYSLSFEMSLLKLEFWAGSSWKIILFLSPPIVFNGFHVAPVELLSLLLSFLFIKKGDLLSALSAPLFLFKTLLIFIPLNAELEPTLFCASVGRLST